jgi:ABC-type amino acid transport substrate-binding protein
LNQIYKAILSILLCIILPSSFATPPLRIGTVLFDPPYVISINQGFEIDLMQQICTGLKTTCTFIPMKYNELFIRLKEEKIDLAMDGLDFYITTNPLNGPFIYSLPYLLSKGQLLILKNNPATQISDLPPQSKIGIVREQGERGSGIFYQFFEKKYAKQFNLVQYTALNQLIADLSRGKIAAAFLDNNQANHWILNGKGLFKALGDPVKVADGIGIAALPENKGLMDEVNQQLTFILNSPAYAQLYDTYIKTLPKRD